MYKNIFPLCFSFVFLACIPNVFAHSDTVVKMSDVSFEPKIVEIHVGETIIFENVGNKNRWPASNMHPSHAIYPEFDSKKPMSPRETWKFTFSKPGTWKFHDHLDSSITGTVVVTGDIQEIKNSIIEKKSVVRRIIDFMLKLFQKKEIVPEVIAIEPSTFAGKSVNEITQDPKLVSAYIKNKGIQEAMDALIRESGGGSVYDCHQQAHTIGRVGNSIFGEQAFKSCTASCHSGCYHGAMESFLNKNGTENLSKNIKRICTSFGTSFGTFECLHGVGHGILAYTNYDVPEAIIECQNLGDSFSTSACYGGLFMENILTGQGSGASINDHKTSWVKKDDPLFPCNAIGTNTELLYQCYQMQTSWMLTINNYDFSKTAEWCMQAPKDMISVCIKSYGRDAAGHTLRNPQKIVPLCKLISSENNYRNECITGAVNVVIDFWGEGLKSQASELCQLTEGDAKDTCYNVLISRLGGLFTEKSKKLEICETITESSYKEQCFLFQ